MTEPAEIESWLQWAGQRLLSLQVGRVRPQAYRSFWPDYPDSQFTAFGYTGERLNPAPPSASEIPLMDDVLGLVIYIDNITSRRIVNSRCLITPISQRHLYSWSKLAFMLHTSRYLVKSAYNSGITQISEQIPEELVYRFRTALRPSFPA